MEKQILHAIRQFNSQQSAGFDQHGGQGGDQDQACLTESGVTFLQDLGLVIVLVELLRQVIGIVRDKGRRQRLRSLRDLLRIGVDDLDQANLLGAQRRGRVEDGVVRKNPLVVRLAQDAADAGVRVLDEGARVPVEIDAISVK